AGSADRTARCCPGQGQRQSPRPTGRERGSHCCADRRSERRDCGGPPSVSRGASPHRREYLPWFACRALKFVRSIIRSVENSTILFFVSSGDPTCARGCAAIRRLCWFWHRTCKVRTSFTVPCGSSRSAGGYWGIEHMREKTDD